VRFSRYRAAQGAAREENWILVGNRQGVGFFPGLLDGRRVNGVNPDKGPQFNIFNCEAFLFLCHAIGFRQFPTFR
jgi:hypothetical protein